MTARKPRRTQRELDREAISWGGKWTANGRFPFACPTSQPFATASMVLEVSEAAARELNRIAREHRAGRGK